MSQKKKTLETKIQKLKAELMEIGGMRPGALSQQFAACRKPGCACVDPVKPRKHGPFYQLSYSHRSKSTTRFVRPGYVATIKRELANYKRFRKLADDWVALEIELSQLKLEDSRRNESK